MFDVLVAGAGIGGLAAALSLHKAGFRVAVREAVPEIRPLGVGINLLPHSVKHLFELGLQPALDASAIRTSELRYYSKHGRLIWREPRGLDAGYRWPQYSIHRGRLQMLLLDAARERLGPDAILTGRAVTDLAEADGRVRVRLRASDGAEGEEEARLLVAADGIHSTIRRTFYPAEGPPIWNGAVLWRGLSEAKPYLDGRTMCMSGHQAQKFVNYPIGPADPASGLAPINWIAELRFDPKNDWRREDWNRAGRIEEFLPRFAGWTFDWLDIPALVRSARAIYEYPMVDRDPLGRWTFGRATLLGDAAHPMYPIGSNGASQAILDARALTAALLAHGPQPAALEQYEAERRPRTSAIVLANRGNGPEQVMQMVEERAPDGFARLEDVIGEAELREVAATYKRLAGFDPSILNGEPAMFA
ncbi:MAG: flavin-dependent oxidoreductase [Alphaproteobacteria bacterium]|nr:flavin-dependent oxidoreductase [Alphaproteobacteria bacterium]